MVDNGLTSKVNIGRQIALPNDKEEVEKQSIHANSFGRRHLFLKNAGHSKSTMLGVFPFDNLSKLKMKKTFTAFLFVSLTLIGVIVGCSKSQNNQKIEDPNNLSEDKTFIELATETYDYLLFVSRNLKNANLTQPEVQGRLLAIQNQSYGEQMKSIDIMFNSAFSVRLESHMKTYASIWKSLKSKYKDISQEVLEKECAEVLSKKYSKQNRNTNLASRAELDCGWRYYLCAGAATAGAVLCHAGCDTTALATTAGLGIPACVAACGTLQAFAIVQCSDSYCTSTNPS